MNPEPTTPAKLASRTENPLQDDSPTEWDGQAELTLGLEENYGLAIQTPEPRRCYHIQTERVRGRTGYRCRGCGVPVCLKTVFFTEVELGMFEQWQKDEEASR